MLFFPLQLRLGGGGGGVRVGEGERGGVAGGVGQAVTAVHAGLNRKGQFFFLHVMLIECFSLSACWLLDLQMY